MTSRLEWVRIDETYDGERVPGRSTYRAKVPGGWLLSVWTTAPQEPAEVGLEPGISLRAGGMTFVHDPMHSWVLDGHRTP